MKIFKPLPLFFLGCLLVHYQDKLNLQDFEIHAILLAFADRTMDRNPDFRYQKIDEVKNREVRLWMEKMPRDYNPIGRISHLSTIIHEGYNNFNILNQIFNKPINAKAFHPAHSFRGLGCSRYSRTYFRENFRVPLLR